MRFVALLIRSALTMMALQLTHSAAAQCSTVLDPGYTTGTFTSIRSPAHAQTFVPATGGQVCEIRHGLDTRGRMTAYDFYVIAAPGTGAPPTNYTSIYLFRALNQTSFNTLGGGGINGKVTVAGLTLVAGQRYAIVIVPIGGMMAWRGNNGNPYPPGQAWVRSGASWAVSVPADYTFRVMGLTPPPNNDSCGTPRVIGIGTVASTTAGATTDGSSSCGGTNDVGFSYTAGCNGTVVASVCGPTFDSILSVHTSCPGTSANQITCNDDCSGTPCGGPGSCVAFAATCGATYRIRVASFSGTGTFNLTISQSAPTPPTNNNIASAITVGSVTNLAFSTCGATTDGPADCAALNDIWYRYTPPCQGTVRVDLCGSSFDTYLAVYTGTPGNLTLVPGACNDDNGPGCSGLSSSLQFSDILCTTYYIRVGGYAGQVGCGDLTISCASTAAVNDTCANAIPLSMGLMYGTTVGATPSLPASLIPAPCGASGNTADVWYTYVAPCNGQLSLETCPTPCAGGRYDTVVSVYIGSCNVLNQIAGACNDDVNCSTNYALSSRVVVNVLGGVNYKVRVSGYSGRTGNFGLQAAFAQQPPPANDNICNASAAQCGITAFTTCGATTSTESGMGCAFTNDVWFRFTTPNCGGPVTVSTCNSNMADTVLGVYSGTCTAPVPIACNDDAGNDSSCSFTQWSSVTFAGAPSTTYWVRVGSPVGQTGNGVVTITCPPPTTATCPPTSGAANVSVLYDINGLASNTPWAFRIMIPCCFDLYVANVPGVPTSNDQDTDEDALRDRFVAAINAACPGVASAYTYDGALVTNHGVFGIKARHCGTGQSPQLWVGPAGTTRDALCLVTSSGLPTVGPCSFNPDVEEVDLPGTDCNANGEDDYVDILRGTSLDANRNNIPDECDQLAARTSQFGVSCPASSAGLDLKTSLPVIGSTVNVTLDGGTAGALAFLAMAPRAPVPMPGFANCLIYVDVTQFIGSFPMPPLDARGHTEVGLPLPNNGALRGFELALQVLATDAGSPVGFGLSNGALMVLGF